MDRAIIVHGMVRKDLYYDLSRDSESNANWLPWLQKQLLACDILAQTPEMPKPYVPDYAAWSRQLEQNVINSNTLLVGYSCGAGFLLRWLNEHRVQVAKLVLVAPWLDPDGKIGDMMKFKISPNIVNKTHLGVHVLYSLNDADSVQKSVDTIRQSIPSATFYDYDNYGHFRYEDMKTRSFPSLLDICIGNR